MFKKLLTIAAVVVVLNCQAQPHSTVGIYTNGVFTGLYGPLLDFPGSATLSGGVIHININGSVSNVTATTLVSGANVTNLVDWFSLVLTNSNSAGLVYTNSVVTITGTNLDGSGKDLTFTMTTQPGTINSNAANMVFNSSAANGSGGGTQTNGGFIFNLNTDGGSHDGSFVVNLGLGGGVGDGKFVVSDATGGGSFQLSGGSFRVNTSMFVLGDSTFSGNLNVDSSKIIYFQTFSNFVGATIWGPWTFQSNALFNAKVSVSGDLTNTGGVFRGNGSGMTNYPYQTVIITNDFVFAGGFASTNNSQAPIRLECTLGLVGAVGGSGEVQLIVKQSGGNAKTNYYVAQGVADSNTVQVAATIMSGAGWYFTNKSATGGAKILLNTCAVFTNGF